MIKLQSVYKSYFINNKEIKVLIDFNYTFTPNTFYVIKGQSGSGKSTLLDIISLNDFSFKGNVLYKDKNIKTLENEETNNLKSEITYLVQGQSLIDYLSAVNNIKLADNSQSIEIVEVLMKRFKLFDKLFKKVSKLSGGEKQRLGVLRSLSTNNKVLILDEPTSNLDSFNRGVFLNEIRNYVKNRILIIATHDLDLIAQADVVISIDDNKLKVEKSKKINKKYVLPKQKTKHSVYYLVLAELTANIKQSFLFIATLTTAIVGLLIGIVISNGFKEYFVKALDNEVNKNLIVVSPLANDKVIKFSEFYYFESLNPLEIISDYFVVYDNSIDNLNHFLVDNTLRNDELSLVLDASTYNKYLASLRSGPFQDVFKITANGTSIRYSLVNVKLGEAIQIVANKDFNSNLIKNLNLTDMFNKTKALITNNQDLTYIFEITSNYQVSKVKELNLILNKNFYLNAFDIAQFKNPFICNSNYGLYCDLNFGKTYINTKIDNKNYIVELKDSQEIKISKDLSLKFSTRDNTIYYQDFVLLQGLNYKITDDPDLIIYYPFENLFSLLKDKHGLFMQATNLISIDAATKDYLKGSYKISHPYHDFLEPFENINKNLSNAIFIYGIISLILGLITISILTLFEVDSKKRNIASLMLLGWSKSKIFLVVLILNSIKTLIAFIVELLLLSISLNNINNVFKSLTNYDNLFKFPSVSWILIFIITIEIIVGFITFFTLNSIFKAPPKKLLSKI